MVSGIKRVEKIPVNMKKAKISRLDNKNDQSSIPAITTIGGDSHVLDESVGTTDVTELSETDLGNNSSKLAGGGRDTVCGRTVTGREGLTRNNESGGVGAKVLEEVGHAIEEDESLGGASGGGEFVVTKTHDDEEDGKDDEAHKLNGLATPAVDEDERDPVSRDETSNGEN